MDALFTQPLPLVVIAALAVTVVSLARYIMTLNKEIKDLYEVRLQDERANKEKLVGPLEKVSEMAEKTYELLISSKRGR